MTRLIDKDMLIEILGVMQGLCDTKAALIQNSKIWQQVKDLPTIDAVPVVRCKDCKWYKTNYSWDGKNTASALSKHMNPLEKQMTSVVGQKGKKNETHRIHCPNR